jgi:hypothetical protein
MAVFADGIGIGLVFENLFTLRANTAGLIPAIIPEFPDLIDGHLLITLAAGDSALFAVAAPSLIVPLIVGLCRFGA